MHRKRLSTLGFKRILWNATNSYVSVSMLNKRNSVCWFFRGVIFMDTNVIRSPVAVKTPKWSRKLPILIRTITQIVSACLVFRKIRTGFETVEIPNSDLYFEFNSMDISKVYQRDHFETAMQFCCYYFVSFSVCCWLYLFHILLLWACCVLFPAFAWP